MSRELSEKEIQLLRHAYRRPIIGRVLGGILGFEELSDFVTRDRTGKKTEPETQETPEIDLPSEAETESEKPSEETLEPETEVDGSIEVIEEPDEVETEQEDVIEDATS